LSKNVSERERLYIAGHYYENVAGDIPKVIETLQEAIQAYPGQIDNYININVAYQSLGQYEQGLAFAQKSVELDPQDDCWRKSVVRPGSTGPDGRSEKGVRADAGAGFE
jgi:tetratricopeptide (TPR) repeat protein